MTNKHTHNNLYRTALSLVLLASMAFAGAALADEKGKSSKSSKYDTASDTVRPLLSPVTNSLTPIGGVWSAQGPAPIVNGASVVTNGDGVAAGAINAVVTHPTNADIIWIGSVNGGIWKTTNATSGSPTWTPQTDAVGSLSISVLERDPNDGTHNTLVGATAIVSSYYAGAPEGHLLRTTNGGTNWTELTALAGNSITSVAARGATIVVGTRNCVSNQMMRSTNTGASFTAVSGINGPVWDIAGHPTTLTTLYAVVGDCVGTGGVFRSTNTGSTWTKVSSSAIDALLDDAADADIVVGASGQVFVAIQGPLPGGGAELAGLFRSPTGTSWVQLESPTTVDSGFTYSLHPGKQAGIHFSMAAEPSNSNLVYVGGDANRVIGGWGRIFRVDAGATFGSQDEPMVNCPSATTQCNGAVGTNNDTAPHADSRAMAIDANGDLIETDDGGIYKRTNPEGTGDWVSLNGNLQITEMHNVAWDSVSNQIMGGTQDNGTPEQTTLGGTTWRDAFGADGGDASIDDVSSPTTSLRYLSAQNLDGFKKRRMDSNGAEIGFRFPTRTLVGGGSTMIGQFTTPVELNAVDPSRILFAGSNGMYESLDRGDTITQLSTVRFDAMVYGGRSGSTDHLDLIWAVAPQPPGGGTWGPYVYRRASGGGAPSLTSSQPSTTHALRDIAIDPNDVTKAYVVSEGGEVFTTANSGASWTNITGNLGSGTNDLYAVTVIQGSPNLLVVAGLNGVFRMATNNAGVWNQFGTGLTNALVYDMEYDALDDVLIASTMGRGAWKLGNVITSGPVPTVSVNDVTVTEGNSGTVNATFTATLSASTPYTVNVKYAASNGTATAASTPVSNTSAITIPDSGNASPYPSSINVSGLSGTIAKVTVTLNNLSHTFPGDLDIVLTGPGNRKIMLMSDAGGGGSISNTTLTFDETAAAQLPSFGITSGTYRPTDYEPGEQFQTPSPFYFDVFSDFYGTSPNGTWSLYVVDDTGGDSGSFAGGWTVTFTLTGDYFPASGFLAFNPGVTSKTFTIPVTGDTTAEITETFTVTLSNPINATIADGTGVGTITNDDAITAPTSVEAEATTATNVEVSWTAASVANTYRVYRSSNGSTYSQVGEVSSSPFNDNTAAADTAYLYKVRAFAGVESADSNIDLATTVIFTDPTLTATVTTVKLAHFTQLLTAVNAVRALAGSGTYPAISFSAPTPSTSVTVRAAHVADLRNGITAPRNALLGGSLTFTDPMITAGTTLIKAVHITDLRNAVK